MRLHDPLDGILRGRGSLHVLRILCRFPTGEFTGRELARQSGISLSHLQGTLDDLEWEGLVRKRRAGRSLLWSARPENLLFAPLEALLALERQLPQRLVEELRAGLRGAPIRRATLFGSTARSEEQRGSDVDVLLELARASDREALQAVLVALTDRIHDKFGLTVSPTVLSREQLKEPSRRSFLENAQRDGVVLWEAT